MVWFVLHVFVIVVLNSVPEKYVHLHLLVSYRSRIYSQKDAGVDLPILPYQVSGLVVCNACAIYLIHPGLVRLVPGINPPS